MDVISAATALITVTQLTVQLYFKCQSYCDMAKEAPEEIKRLHHETESFRAVLARLSPMTQSPDTAAKVPALVDWMKDDGPTNECRLCLDKLLTTLDKMLLKQSSSKHVWKNLDWPLKKMKKIDHRTTILQAYKTSLNFVMSTDTL